MLKTETGPILTPGISAVVTTNADNDSPITGKHKEEWQAFIDSQLVEWGRRPEQFADEGVEPPASAAVQRAIRWVQVSIVNNELPPDSAVLDANGGIVFERREGNVSEVFHVWDDGAMEYRRFDGTHLAERFQI